MTDESDKGVWIAAIERALKVSQGNGAKTHSRVAAIKKPAGCDPCSYPECGCAYSQDDNRRAGRRPVAALATPPHRKRRADAMSDDTSAREIAIRALKFVKVNTKRGFLTDISVAMILVEMERSGIKFQRPLRRCS